jgi:hypothetical protein
LDYSEYPGNSSASPTVEGEVWGSTLAVLAIRKPILWETILRETVGLGSIRRSEVGVSKLPCHKLPIARSAPQQPKLVGNPKPGDEQAQGD